MAPTKAMIEFFDECLNQNIDLTTLSNSYILHTIGRTGTKKGSAKKLGLTFFGLKKRLTKFGIWNESQTVDRSNVA